VGYVVVTAADLPYGPLGALTEDLLRAVRSKVLGPLLVAQAAAPRITAGGSINVRGYETADRRAARRPAPDRGKLARHDHFTRQRHDNDSDDAGEMRRRQLEIERLRIT
jgi:hypothetical protein